MDLGKHAKHPATHSQKGLMVASVQSYRTDKSCPMSLHRARFIDATTDVHSVACPVRLMPSSDFNFHQNNKPAGIQKLVR